MIRTFCNTSDPFLSVDGGGGGGGQGGETKIESEFEFVEETKIVKKLTMI